MGIADFYKQRKPSKFRYIPRYYDPKKEAMQKKIDRARRKYYPEEFSDEDSELYKDKIRGAFHNQSEHLRGYTNRDKFRGQMQEKNWILFLILSLLLVFFFWLYDNIGINYLNYFIDLFR